MGLGCLVGLGLWVGVGFGVVRLLIVRGIVAGVLCRCWVVESYMWELLLYIVQSP